MKRLTFYVGVAIMAIVLCAGIVGTASATAGVPKSISYQGRLYDSSGSLLGGAGTTYCFKFSIWDNATVGAGTKLWPAGSPTAAQLSVKNGVFNANIGIDTADALTYNFYTNDTIYLQVEVAAFSGSCGSYETLGSSSGGRQQIVSAGYAINAGTVGGASVGTGANNVLQLDSSGNIALSAGSSQISSSGSNTLTLQGGATGDLQFFSSSNKITSAGALTLASSVTATTGNFTAASSLVLGTASSAIGGIIFKNGTNANTVTINSGATGTTYALTLPTAQASGSQFLQNDGSGVLSWQTGGGGCGTCVWQVPGSTAQNTIAPTVASTVALTVKGTTGTAANVLEVFDSTASPARQAYFDNTGALILSKPITAPTSSNTINSLIVNSGALSGVTGLTQTSGTDSFTSAAVSGNVVSIADTAFNTDAGKLASLTFTNANSTSTATAISGVSITPTGATNSNSNANTLNAILLPAVTPVTNNAFYGINVGTGYNDILRYNGAQLISGTGIVQSAAISGSYTGITGTGALAAGSLASGFTAVGPTLGGTGANNTATSGRYLKGDGSNFVTSSGSASGIGACSAHNWASTLNSDAAPTCTQPAFADLSDTTLTVASGKITKYNNVTTVENGVPSLVKNASATTQGANITATTIYTSAPAGRYEMCAVVTDTRAATTSSTVPVGQLIFTDVNGSVVKTINLGAVNATNTTGAGTTGCGLANIAASTNIQYSTGGYSSSGATTMQYDLYITLAAL